MQAIAAARLKEMNPLVLAFVGDAVFTLRVRETLAAVSDCKTGMLSGRAGKIVSATAQARLYETLSPGFSEEETEIARRARNQHTNNTAKNALPEDYKKSTALEAVIGYHHLAGNTARLEELLSAIGAQL